MEINQGGSPGFKDAKHTTVSPRDIEIQVKAHITKRPCAYELLGSNFRNSRTGQKLKAASKYCRSSWQKQAGLYCDVIL